MKLSEQKTQLVIFTRKTLPDEITPIILNDTPIEITESAKFLGVYLDIKLSWKSHAKYTRIKAAKALRIIKAIAGIRWGAHPNTLLTIYKGLVRAIMDWGSIFYANALAHELTSLDRIQYASLRNCLGCIATTPTNTLLYLAAEPPLHLRRRFLTQKYLTKTHSRQQNI